MEKLNWQKAVKLSFLNKAVRIDRNTGRKMFRYADGYGIIETITRGVFRLGQDCELEGFLDWHPDV